jgi:hypothetical protein
MQTISKNIEQNQLLFEAETNLRRIRSMYSDCDFERFETLEGRRPTARERVECRFLQANKMRAAKKKKTNPEAKKKKTNPEANKTLDGNDLALLAQCTSTCHICNKLIHKNEDNVSGIFITGQKEQWVHTHCT